MEWFETWFDTPYYHILYKNHNQTEAESFISKLLSVLTLKKGAKIIDLACGKGRHSLYLNNLGYDVLGLDLSHKSIAHNTLFENDTLQFQVHDMRDEILMKEVDAVLNLFTSFGYFENIEDEKKVFHSVYHCLKKGGYFVLDYLNEKKTKEELVKEEVLEKEGIVFNIKKRIEDNFIIKDIYFEVDGEQKHYYEKVRLHTPEEIDQLASAFDFEKLHEWGDYGLHSFDPNTSKRCIHLYRKR